MKLSILFLFLISFFSFTLEQRKTCETENTSCINRCNRDGGPQKNMCLGICKGMYKKCTRSKNK